MKSYCIKTYTTELDMSELDIHIKHTVFKIGHFYESFLIDSGGRQWTETDEYSVDGEDGVNVVFEEKEFKKYFVTGVANIRNAKLERIGV